MHVVKTHRAIATCNFFDGSIIMIPGIEQNSSTKTCWWPTPSVIFAFPSCEFGKECSQEIIIIFTMFHLHRAHCCRCSPLVDCRLGLTTSILLPTPLLLIVIIKLGYVIFRSSSLETFKNALGPLYYTMVVWLLTPNMHMYEMRVAEEISMGKFSRPVSVFMSSHVAHNMPLATCVHVLEVWGSTAYPL